MAEFPSLKITPAMIDAGVDVLSHWRFESDFVGEREAVLEIFQAMCAAANIVTHDENQTVPKA